MATPQQATVRRRPNRRSEMSRRERGTGSLAERLLCATALVLAAGSFSAAAEVLPPDGPPAATVVRPATLPFRTSEQRATCADYAPERRPFFGDLHVHTARSQDASTQDTRVTPSDAYRFARGEALGIQPFDAAGQALRTVKLDRPLDFAAVTDHAEQIG